MGLKQSVVVVNEYTIKTGSKGGSRGGSPGEYVLRYMARQLATEKLAPVRLTDEDTMAARYMIRRDVTDRATSVSNLKRDMRNHQRYGGVAFGYGDVALSDNALRHASRDIQKAFDNGKTVLKTVLSFDEEYLRQHGIISEDFVCKKRGDYRGNIDQLKLRLAIMNGIARMGRDYDDLQYVGVIQVDTKHVHCHLALVDKGRGNLAKDGTQKGKISEKSKAALRRGIDMWLDEKQAVKAMSSSVVYDRRNALCYIKKYTHKAMAQNGFSQFLLACLPDNKNWWRAGSNRSEMRKPNAMVREFVAELLREPGSGYREAVDSVERYAAFRKESEGLSQTEYEKLVREGERRIVDDCMNGVYSVLKQVPQSQRTVRTPMLEAMSQDYESMAIQSVNDPMVEFGFRLRSYSARLDYHRKECRKYRELVDVYERTPDKEAASAPMGEFFRVEEEYNEMLMSKYQHFLTFLPTDEGIEEEFYRLVRRKESLRDLQRMRNDAAFRKMTDKDAAREYGLRVYGQYGGDKMLFLPSVIDTRIQKLSDNIKEEERAFRRHLQDFGMDYDGHGIKRTELYPFSDVKALDLHHMGYDFPYDVEVSQVNVDAFCKMADERWQAFEAARDYLVHTGQEDAVSDLPVRDLEVMKEYADRMRGLNKLEAKRPASGQFHRVQTVRLDLNYEQDMKTAIRATVRSLQMEQ